MRLFGKVDGAINRFDRAQYMTPPFDQTFPLPPQPPVSSAPPSTFRRPQETTINYRREFGQADTP